MAKIQKPIILRKKDIGWVRFKKWEPVKERPILCVIKTRRDLFIGCPSTHEPPKNEWEKKFTIKIIYEQHVRMKKIKIGYGYLKIFAQYPVKKKDVTEKMGTVKDYFWKKIKKKLDLFDQERLLQFKNEYYKKK